MDEILSGFFCSRLRALLEVHSPQRLNLPGYTPAGVLLVLWPQPQEPHLLFIRRSDRVRHHKGEISFPGGRWEPSDRDLSETALREAHEEVGLPLEPLALLGRLDDAFSFSRYAIAPFVGALPSPPRLRPNEEVAELLPLALRRFRPEEFDVGYRDLDGDTVPIYTYEIDGRVIWGATARILKGFLDLIRSDPEMRSFLDGETRRGGHPFRR